MNYFLSLIFIVKSEQNLELYLRKLSKKLRNNSDYEIIIIENSGIDENSLFLSELTNEEGLPNLQIFKLADRIEDYEARWLALENSLGDFIICLDLDLIDNLNLFEKMIEKINQGNEIVLLKTQPIPIKNKRYKNIIYGLMGAFSKRFLGINLNTYSSSNIVISRRILNYLLKFKNPELYFRDISSLKGIKKSVIIFKENLKNKSNLRQSIARGLRVITSNSSLPLRFATLISSLGAIFSFLYSIYVIIILIIKDNIAPGWASISLQLSIMFFCLSFVLLIMSEYILESLNKINNKPKYFISEEFTSSKMTFKEKLNVNEFHN